MVHTVVDNRPCDQWRITFIQVHKSGGTTVTSKWCKREYHPEEHRRKGWDPNRYQTSTLNYWKDGMVSKRLVNYKWLGNSVSGCELWGNPVVSLITYSVLGSGGFPSGRPSPGCLVSWYSKGSFKSPILHPPREGFGGPGLRPWLLTPSIPITTFSPQDSVGGENVLDRGQTDDEESVDLYHLWVGVSKDRGV